MADKEAKMKLRALQCNGCGKPFVPPRYRCDRCGGEEFVEVHLRGEGEIYSYTVIRVPFEEFVPEAPYVFAEVRLDEGLVVPARLTEQEQTVVKIGSRVSFVRWDRGVNWFRLVSQGSPSKELGDAPAAGQLRSAHDDRSVWGRGC